jgi:acetyl esterase/lipase
MASLVSKLTLKLTEPIEGSKPLYSAAKLDVSAFREHDSKRPPAWALPGVKVSAGRIGGLDSHTLTPRDLRHPDRVALYLHGGAYIYGPLFWHWVGCASIARRSGVRFELPDYPMAPETDTAGTIDAVIAAYEDLVGRHGAEHVTVMGDSAGGGLSAALALEAARRGLPQPRRIVLLSPWVDVAMTDRKAAAALDPLDPMLSMNGLVACGELYAGSPQAAREPNASPLFDDLSNLPETWVYGSDRDMLLPQIRAFVDRAREQGAPVNYTECPGQIHVWPMVPVVPEAIRTRGAIAGLLESV